MSNLLNSGQVGVLDKERNSNEHIYDRWEQSGLLYNLDSDVSTKVALAMEIGAHWILMEGKMRDIYSENTGTIASDGVHEKFDVVIFPILRRIISRTPEAIDYVPEIMNMSKEEYSTNLCRRIYEGNEKAMIHFYDNVLPKWSNYHRERTYKNYDELKKTQYEKHIIRCRERGVAVDSYETFIPLDWEAEFCACISEKIEGIIIEHIKNKKDETNTL